MPDPTTLPHLIRFGIYEVNLRAGELRKSGLRIRLQDQPFQVLAMLLEHPGEIVPREEFRKRLWSEGTFVDFDHSLGTAINKIREALGDSAENPRFVETLHRRGYRFIAPVDSVAPVYDRRTEAAAHRAALQKRLTLAVGIVVVALAALVALNFAGLRERLLRAVGAVREPPLQIHSIAVLPLENLSHDPEQEYFADGMTDALITDLGKISALRVISRTSVMTYKGKRKPLPEIAKELNVDGVVEGTVLRSGDRVRITANLLHAPTDRHLWSESYERDLRDVLALQNEIARAVAREVQVKLTPQEQTRLARSRPVDPAAHEAFLKGRYFFQGTMEGMRKGLVYLQQAVEKDPGYAEAYACLSWAYINMDAARLLPHQEALRKAKAAAVRALELDETLADAHAAAGSVNLFYEWDWLGAERECKRAMELSPNSQEVRDCWAGYLIYMGRFDEGIEATKRAFEMAPLSRMGLAIAYFWARRHDDSIRELNRQLELSPAMPWVHAWLAANYLLKGMDAQAIAACQKFRELEPGASYAWVCTAPNAFLGRRDEGQRELALYLRTSQVDPYLVACIYAGMGKVEKAFDWLRKAYEERSPNIILVKVDPMIDLLRSDPRFKDLLRRMNFPP